MLLSPRQSPAQRQQSGRRQQPDPVQLAVDLGAVLEQAVAASASQVGLAMSKSEELHGKITESPNQAIRSAATAVDTILTAGEPAAMICTRRRPACRMGLLGLQHGGGCSNVRCDLVLPFWLWGRRALAAFWL